MGRVVVDKAVFAGEGGRGNHGDKQGGVEGCWDAEEWALNVAAKVAAYLQAPRGEVRGVEEGKGRELKVKLKILHHRELGMSLFLYHRILATFLDYGVPFLVHLLIKIFQLGLAPLELMVLFALQRESW
jgi:hypothetical protein